MNLFNRLVAVNLLVLGFSVLLFSMESESEAIHLNEIEMKKVKAHLFCAEMCLNGRGVKQDFEQARSHLESVLEIESSQELKARAYWLLAKMYYFGYGVDANKTLMDSYLEKACLAAALTEQAQAMYEAAEVVRAENNTHVPLADTFGMTALHRSAVKGNPLLAEIALGQGVDVNSRNLFGRTALHTAAWKGNKAVAELLLDNGAQVQCASKKGETALHIASWKGHASVAELLLAYGSDPNAKDTDAQGWTPLERAFWKGHSTLVSLLVSKGALLLAKDLAGSCFLDKALVVATDGDFKRIFNQGSKLGSKNIVGGTFLHWAAQMGRKDLTQIALENGTDVNRVDENGSTALHRAVESGSREVVQLLLAEGALVNGADQRGRCPLHLAAACAENIVELLISMGADVRMCDLEGRTALYYAAEKGNCLAVKQLLEKNADPNVVDKSGETIVQSSRASWNPQVVKLLIDHGADIDVEDSDAKTVLHKAAARGRKEVVELLLTQNAFPDARDRWGETPIHYAIHMNYSEVVMLLLQRGACIALVDAQGASYLERAVGKGHKSVVNVLLSHTPTQNLKNKGGRSLLCDAPTRGVAEILIDHGLDVDEVDEVGMSPLHFAVAAGRVEVVELLLDKHANSDLQDARGFTPLLVAIECNKKLVVKRLLERGANPRLSDNKGLSPLHWAAKKNRKEIVRMLLPKHADSSALNKKLDTALHIAASRGHSEIVNILLTLGADPNVLDSKGRTPLHRVAEFAGQALKPDYSSSPGCYTDCVHLLLAHGADYHVPDKAGLTPFHVAACKGNRGALDAFLGSVPNPYKHLLQETLRCYVAHTINSEMLELFAGWGMGGVRQNVTRLLDYVAGVKDKGKTQRQFDSAYKKVVANYLNCSVDVNLRAFGNVTPLYCAALLGKTEVVELLVNNGADVNAASVWSTPLHCAMANEEMMTVLLKGGALVDSIDSVGNTPLHCAASIGNEKTVRLLLAYKASLSKTNKEGLTAAQLVDKKAYPQLAAFLRSSTESLERDSVVVKDQQKLDYDLLCYIAHGQARMDLIQQGASVNATSHGATVHKGATVLMYAAHEQLLPFCTYLCQNGSRVNDSDSKGLTPLMWNASGRRSAENNDVCQLLIAAGADCNAKSGSGKTALLIAAKNCARCPGTATLATLITHTKEIDARDKRLNSALLHAVKGGAEEASELLIQAGADVNAQNAKGETALWFAIDGELIKLSQLLLVRGARSNVKNQDGKTPLMQAVARENKELCELLLVNNAEVNEVDDDGFSALDLVACSRNFPKAIEIAQLLFAKGAVLSNSKSERGMPSSLLSVAARMGNAALCRLFLDKGAAVNEQDESLYSALHYAAIEGHEEVCRALIEKGADSSLTTVHSSTPLHLAAKHGDVTVGALLINSGAKIKVVDSEGVTPLMEAIRTGNKEFLELMLLSGASLDEIPSDYDDIVGAASFDLEKVIEYLVKQRGVDVNSLDEHGRTALMSAVNARTVQKLLDLGADYTMRTDHGWSLLHLLCVGLSNNSERTLENALEVVELLVARGLNVNLRDDNEQTPLAYALLINMPVDLCACFIRLGADIEYGWKIDSEYGYVNPLILAILNENEEIYDLLVRAQASRERALLKAAEYGYNEVCAFLLDRKVDIQARDAVTGYTALHCAIKAGMNSTVKLLLERGADKESVIQGDQTPLLLAARSDCAEVVGTLIAHQVELKVRDARGRSALHWAAYHGHDAVLELFLAQKVDLDSQDSRWGRTAVHWAALKGHKTALQILLNNGASLERADKSGRTALYLAVVRGESETVELLLARGAERRACDQSKLTCLHVAAMYGYNAIIKILLAQGDAVDATCSLGCTALHYAAYWGHNNAAELLLDSGAHLNATDNNGFTPVYYSFNGFGKKGGVTNILLARGADEMVRVEEKGQTAEKHYSADDLSNNELEAQVNRQETDASQQDLFAEDESDVQHIAVNDLLPAKELFTEDAIPVLKQQTNSAATLKDVPLAVSERLATLRKNKGPKGRRLPSRQEQLVAAVPADELLNEEPEVGQIQAEETVAPARKIKGGVSLFGGANPLAALSTSTLFSKKIPKKESGAKK